MNESAIVHDLLYAQNLVIVPLSGEAPTASVALPTISTWVLFIFFTIYAIVSSSVDRRDTRDTEVIWLNPDDPVHPSHAVFILSFDVKDCTDLYSNLDFYIRLRGTIGDSPLILFRDYDGYIDAGSRFNFGIHSPIVIGPIHAIDIIFDHPMALDEEYLVTIENIEVRDAWWVPWADVGVPKAHYADVFTLTARSTSARIDFVYTKQKYKYNNLHYSRGALDENRILWASLSRLDTVLAMTIDVMWITMMAALLNHFDVIAAPNSVKLDASIKSATMGHIRDALLRGTLLSQISLLINSPLSCIHWRVLQAIGGKQVSADINLIDEDDEDDCFVTSANNTVVRTIECSSLHKGHSTAVARKMRVEPLPTNCLTAELNPQAIAYVRSKMTRLTQDPATLGGKISTTIHRMQSSRPTKSDRGLGKKISGMRFSARNVEQYGDKVYDNIVVCEIYRSAYGSKWGTTEDDGDDTASIAEIVFHFSDDGLKDKGAKQWAMESKIRSHKAKGLQALRHHNNGADDDGEDHWFGRRSTLAGARNSDIEMAARRSTTKHRFTFLDKFRSAPRKTTVQAKAHIEGWDHVNAWKDKHSTKFEADDQEQDNDQSNFRMTSRKQEVQRARKSQGGFLDNSGRRGSSIMRRASMAWPDAPEPSASVWEHEPRKLLGDKADPLKLDQRLSGSSIELTEIKSETQVNLPDFDEETFQTMVDDLVERYEAPKPSAGDYEDDGYEEPMSEDAYSFDSQDDDSEDENIFEHPLPTDKRFIKGPLFRTLYFLVMIIIAMTIGLVFIRKITKAEVAHGFFITQMLALFYYRYMYTYIIASMQLFLERIVCK